MAQVPAELGELRNLLHALAHLFGYESQQQAARHDVLVAGGFGVDSERDAQQRRGSAASPHVAARRLVGPCKHAQQGRLAGAIVSDEPDSVAVLEHQTYVLQRTHGQAVAGTSPDTPAGTVMQQPVLQRACARVVDGKINRDRLKQQMDHRAHTQ